MQRLSDLLRAAWQRAILAPPDVENVPVRMAASVCALDTWPDGAMRMPELVNMGAWAWLARERATIHLVRPSVPRLVGATDLHQLPAEAPRFLRAPWCVEVQRPERGEVLWGSTWALAGYELDGTHYLVGLEGEGCRVVPWTPQWSGRDLAAGVDTRLADAAFAELGLAVPVEAPPEHTAWAREAVRWAIVYGLLQDATGAPLRVTAEPIETPRGGARTPPAKRAAWAVSRVTLTPDGDRIVHAATSTNTGTENAPREGLIASRATVGCHLKRQRFGPGNSQVRWIFVESYEARRWVAPWTTRDVSARPS